MIWGGWVRRILHWFMLNLFYFKNLRERHIKEVTLIFNVEQDEYFALIVHQTKSLNENLHSVEAEITYKNTCRRAYNPRNLCLWLAYKSFLNFEEIARILLISLCQESFVVFCGKSYRIFIMLHLDDVRLCLALYLEHLVQVWDKSVCPIHLLNCFVAIIFGHLFNNTL